MSLSPSSLGEECISVRFFRRDLPNGFEFLLEIWALLTKPSWKPFHIPQFKIRSICSDKTSVTDWCSMVVYECQILLDFFNFVDFFIGLIFSSGLYTVSYLYFFFIYHYFRFLQEKSNYPLESALSGLKYLEKCH